MSNIHIGLFGFGVVGEGIYKVLTQKKSLGATIKKVVIKHPHKKRNAPKELFSTERKDILDDGSIDLVVELIDDADAAYEIVTSALKSGKSVVSANKKMIAENHVELISLSKKHNASFLYEAAVCGSVPIIRNLEEYFDNDLLNSVRGIVNGSTNFILSKMSRDNHPYQEALQVAQEEGYAERDPSLDVEGVDAAYKLSIITLHGFGKRVDANEILRKGISALNPFDFQYAKEKGLVIKLIARSYSNEQGELKMLSVLPTFLSKQETLSQTNNEFNGVVIGSALADEQFFYGKGAGRYPTSSAVLSDISAYQYGYKYAYKKGIHDLTLDHRGAGKFYMGFDNRVAFDASIFDLVDEKFTNKKRTHFIGTVKYDRLVSSNLLSDRNISVIAYA